MDAVINLKNFIKANDQTLWYETFGNFKDPAVLLIQGSGAQSILWPEKFCNLLAKQRYFVIRYDHRDTGKSSIVDFNTNPYNLSDLTKDAIELLNKLGINKAHIIGSSMGGYIAQLLGAYYPDRIHTITLMMTSIASISLDYAFLAEDENPLPLPLPTKLFSNAILSIPANNPNLPDHAANQLVSIWSAYNGCGKFFDQNTWLNLARAWISRSTVGLNNINHRLAIGSSPLTRTNELSLIKAPTLIIHGNKDPFFVLEHAYALKTAIIHSSLKIIEGMGHLFHEIFIREILLEILLNFKSI